MSHITDALRRPGVGAPVAVVLLALCLLAVGVQAANGSMDTSAFAPFPGTHPVPGTVQAEDFDAGGEGVAYHDTEPANLGGAYRPAEGVDIETVGSVTDVGWIRSGEWLAYTLTAATPQTVVVRLRAANPDATAKRVAVLTNGTVAGTVDLLPTGSFDAYGTSVSTAFALPAGATAIWLSFDGIERINLDSLDIEPPATPEPTLLPTPEAELLIATPGLHTLDADLPADSHIGVLITSPDVVLDGMGHSIEGRGTLGSVGVVVGGVSPEGPVANVTVRNLTVRRWQSGISVARTNGSVVEDVVAEQNSVGLVHGYYESLTSENGVVRDSTFRNNTAVGIMLDHPFQGITVERCRITGNGRGMEVTWVLGTYDSGWVRERSLVADCEISGNEGDGLSIRVGQLSAWLGVVSAVRNCTIRGNGGDGLVVERSYTTIDGNRIEGNGGYGVDAGESGGSTITSNWIQGNRYGVSAGGEWPSRVQNNVLNNTENGVFPAGSAVLNTTKTTGTNIVGGPFLGGNVWAFPNGTGFSQTHPDADGDGFCDAPFVAPQGAVDWLPLATAPAVGAVPGGAGLPTDTNADGKFDDVNGNGGADFADLVLYFAQMSWIAANEPLAPFDYNGNGAIDFADVVWLFNNLGSAPGPKSIFSIVTETEPGLYRFSGAEVQAVRRTTPTEWTQWGQQVGGSWTSRVDPMQILGIYPLLRISDGFVLRSYVYSTMMGAGGTVFALPVDQPFPPPATPVNYSPQSGTGLPPGADLNFTDYLEVEGSPASYLEAVVCSIELRSFAEFWHDVDWRARTILDARPGGRLTYINPEPATWAPTVRVGPSETRVVFHTLSDRTGTLDEYTVRFTPGARGCEWSSICLAYGGPTVTP